MSLDNKGYGFMEEEIDRLRAENEEIKHNHFELMKVLVGQITENEKLRKKSEAATWVCADNVIAVRELRGE